MRYTSHRLAAPLRGMLRVPGDKSISHRAVLFAAMADGTSHLTGVLDSADVRSTISAVEALGARVLVAHTPRIDEGREDDGATSGLALTVWGWGAAGPTTPDHPIDCGNSGTTARLLLGVLAGWPVSVVLRGDRSLSQRPMGRVTDPLSSMGASFETHDGTLPVTVHGGKLTGIDYRSPVASAQVKTAVLLAGLQASGRTTVREAAPSRDHTERMLPAFGVPVDRDEATNSAWVTGPAVPTPADVSVPGDPSSAAFLVAAAVLVPGSEILVPDVALNPTRAGFLRVIARMHGDIAITESGSAGKTSGEGSGSPGEPVGSIRAAYSAGLVPTIVMADEVPTLIDEIPILALVASQARGTTRFEGVGELRVKESDRLAAIEAGLRALGVSVEAGSDWLEVSGPARLAVAELDSLGDHRLAMTWAVAGLIAEGPVTIERFEAVEVSYPSFLDDLARLTPATS